MFWCCSNDVAHDSNVVDQTQVLACVDTEGPEIHQQTPAQDSVAAPALEPEVTPQETKLAHEPGSGLKVGSELEAGLSSMPAAGTDITIEITEPADDLGLEISAEMYILSVRDGFFKTWNELIPLQRVAPNDRILSVNGLTAKDEMTQKLLKPWNLVIVIRKALEFNVIVHKSGLSAKLGLTVVPSEKTSLHIKSVKAGMIEEHNKTCAENQRIGSGDRIVGVCGVRGDIQQLLEQIKNNSTLELVVVRST